MLRKALLYTLARPTFAAKLVKSLHLQCYIVSVSAPGALRDDRTDAYRDLPGAVGQAPSEERGGDRATFRHGVGAGRRRSVLHVSQNDGKPSSEHPGTRRSLRQCLIRDPIWQKFPTCIQNSQKSEHLFCTLHILLRAVVCAKDERRPCCPADP